MCVSLLVGLLSYWNYTNIGISPVLNKISFWIFLETFLGCWSTFSKKFWIFCMSVSVLFGSLSYWNYTIIGISPVLDKISFWIFLETFLGCLFTCSKQFWIFCMSFSLLLGSLSYWNYTNIGISPVLDEVSFWKFLETFLGC